MINSFNWRRPSLGVSPEAYHRVTGAFESQWYHLALWVNVTSFHFVVASTKLKKHCHPPLETRFAVAFAVVMTCDNAVAFFAFAVADAPLDPVGIVLLAGQWHPSVHVPTGAYC